MILSNFNIIPTEAPVYDHVWGYIVPLAIPMLLFNADIKRIGRESGRMVLIFLLSSFGTVAGGFIAYYMMKDVIPQLNDIVPMFTGISLQCLLYIKYLVKRYLSLWLRIIY